MIKQHVFCIFILLTGGTTKYSIFTFFYIFLIIYLDTFPNWHIDIFTRLQTVFLTDL